MKRKKAANRKKETRQLWEEKHRKQICSNIVFSDTSKSRLSIRRRDTTKHNTP